jgi:hypothetical protein
VTKLLAKSLSWAPYIIYYYPGYRVRRVIFKNRFLCPETLTSLFASHLQRQEIPIRRTNPCPLAKFPLARTMTSPATEWPSTPIPLPIKELISHFFVLGDTPTAEAGRELGEKVFTSDGQIVVNKRVIAGTAGTLSVTTRYPCADTWLTFP